MKTLHKPQVYYGWIIVAIGFFTMMLIMGSFFSSGVLFAAIVGETGWSRATVSLPFSIALIVYAGTAWRAGRSFDRYGPRRLFPLGALCLGLGLIVTAQVHTPWQLCLSWGLLVAQGFNLAGIAPHLAHVALPILAGTMYHGSGKGSGCHDEAPEARQARVRVVPSCFRSATALTPALSRRQRGS